MKHVLLGTSFVLALATVGGAREEVVSIRAGALFDGNPLEDITALRRVVFVMKGGKIFR